MEDVVRKIKKALALAHNNTSADEAQNAMMLAQRLMAKHNLSIADFPDEKIEKKTEKNKIIISRIEWWQRRLSGIIADNFRCHSFMSKGCYIGFIGLEEDSRIATEVFKFAVEAIRHYSSEYLKTNKEKRSRAYSLAVKNDYITGFFNGLKDKFAEQVKTESLALVLVKDEIVVREVEEMKLREGSPINKSTAQDQNAINKGYEDGKRFERPVAQLA